MKVGIDYKDLVAFDQKLRNADKVTEAALVKSLNAVGDGVLSVMATSLSKETGLAVEQVRGLMRVKRAKKGDTNYDVVISGRLLEDDPSTLEGQRESRDFGRQRPDTLVIIVNQKDDLVCMDCEELAAAGPMPIGIARAHIPKHPNCRCIIMPYVAKGKRLPVTMTTLTGTDPYKRSGRRQNREMTLRQVAQDILNKTATNIRIELK